MSKRGNTLRERNTDKLKTAQERKTYSVRGSKQYINKKTSTERGRHTQKAREQTIHKEKDKHREMR
jgi:hypothetical protein